MAETERARSAFQHIDSGCARDKWVHAGMAAKSVGLDFDDFHQIDVDIRTRALISKWYACRHLSWLSE